MSSLLRRLFRSIRRKCRRNNAQQFQQLQHPRQPLITNPLPAPDLLDIIAASHEPITIVQAVAVRMMPTMGCRIVTITRSHARPSELSVSPPSLPSPPSAPGPGTPTQSNRTSALVRARQLPPRLPCRPRTIHCTTAGPAGPVRPVRPALLRALSMRPLPALPQLQDLSARRRTLPPPSSSTLPHSLILPMTLRRQNSWDHTSSSSSSANNLPYRSRILLNSSNGGSSISTGTPFVPRLPIMAATPRAVQPPEPQQQRQRRPMLPAPRPPRPSWEPSPRRPGRPHSMPPTTTPPPPPKTTTTTSSKRTSTTFGKILASMSAGQMTPRRRHSWLRTHRRSQSQPSQSQTSPSPPPTSMPPYELSAELAPAPVPATSRPLLLPASVSTRTRTSTSTSRSHHRIAFNSREGHNLLVALRRLLGLPADDDNDGAGFSSLDTLLFVLKHERVRQLAPPADDIHARRVIARCNALAWQGVLRAMIQRQRAAVVAAASSSCSFSSSSSPLARVSPMDYVLVSRWVTSGAPLFTPQTAASDLLLQRHRSYRPARLQLSSSSSEVAGRRMRRHHMWAGPCPSPLSKVLHASELQ